MTNQSVAVFRSTLGEIVNKGFNQISAGISQCGGAAVVGGISPHEASIELVLANQEAKAIAETRLAVVVSIIISACGCTALIGWCRRIRSGGPAEFLD